MHYQGMYVRNGGFPEAFGKSDSERKMILTNVYNDIISRDISARFNASYGIVKKISYHLLTNFANEFSYRSIAQATETSVETAEKYLDYLQESFLILPLDFFLQNKDAIQAK